MQSLDEEIKLYDAMGTEDYNPVDFYNERVEMYEDVILAAGHVDPDLVADTVTTLGLPKDCSILEMGCGTGLFG